MTEIFDDIRKIYEFRLPHNELSDYIEFFSESNMNATRHHIDDNPFTVKMFASFTPTIWINLGSPYHLTMGNKMYRIKTEEDILVTRDTIVERHNFPSDHIFTVKFFPGGLEAVFGMDQTKMLNKVVPLHSIIPPTLMMQVRATNNFEERKKLFEDFFLQRLKKVRMKDYYLRFVTDTIALYKKGNMQFNINEMAGRVFTTSKTINRYFNHVIGTSPKKYLSILRARVALTSFVNNKKTFDPADFGYYDMSHFYKEIVNFTQHSIAV